MHQEAAIELFKEKPNFLHIIFGAIITAYLILLFLLYRVNTVIIVSVVAFDFLFVSLLFPLKGALFNKTLLLLAGNVTGFIWNLLQSRLIDATTPLLVNGFSIVFFLAFPLLNCVWIVFFWSLGLSVLARKNSKKEETSES